MPTARLSPLSLFLRSGRIDGSNGPRVYFPINARVPLAPWEVRGQVTFLARASSIQSAIVGMMEGPYNLLPSTSLFALGFGSPPWSLTLLSTPFVRPCLFTHCILSIHLHIHSKIWGSCTNIDTPPTISYYSHLCTDHTRVILFHHNTSIGL